jgi:hypothetical protein
MLNLTKKESTMITFVWKSNENESGFAMVFDGDVWEAEGWLMHNPIYEWPDHMIHIEGTEVKRVSALWNGDVPVCVSLQV